jgi:hypothetical protein
MVQFYGIELTDKERRTANILVGVGRIKLDVLENIPAELRREVVRDVIEDYYSSH